MTEKIGDAKLAQKIISAFSDLNGFTSVECAAVGLAEDTCGVLTEALNNCWAIGKGEREQLSNSGFSEKFIAKLAGPDGMNALKARVKWLTNVVQEGETYIRRARITAIRELTEYLGHATKDEISVFVSAALKDEHWTVRNTAGELLDEIGLAAKDAVPMLITELKNKDGPRAAYLLGTIGPAAKKAVPALITALKSENSRLRWEAVKALGKIGPAARKAIPALKAALESDNEHWRKAAAEALKKIEGAK